MEILTNPWFVGIGTTIVAGLVVGLLLYFVFGIGKTKPKQEQAKPAMIIKPNTESSPGTLVTSPNVAPTPKEIQEYVRGLPPLQVEQGAINYQGIKVKWKLTLEDAHYVSKRKLHLMMLDQGRYPWIYCDVDPKQYPILKVIRNDQLFTVEGEIEAVNKGVITLRDCTFHF